jgi:hypothetical protein
VALSIFLACQLFAGLILIGWLFSPDPSVKNREQDADQS